MKLFKNVSCYILSDPDLFPHDLNEKWSADQIDYFMNKQRLKQTNKQTDNECVLFCVQPNRINIKTKSTAMPKIGTAVLFISIGIEFPL